MKPMLLACLFMSAAVHALAADAAPAATGGASLPASLPVKRDAQAPSDASGWAPSLALAIAAGAGGAWAWRRRPGRMQAGAPRTEALVRLAHLALTPQASVHAVQWRGEEWLLACTPQQVTLLSRRPLDEEGKR